MHILLYGDTEQLQARFSAEVDDDIRRTLLIELVERLQWESLSEASDWVRVHDDLFAEATIDVQLAWRIAGSLSRADRNSAEQILLELRSLITEAMIADLPVWSAKASHFAGWLAVQLGEYTLAARLMANALDGFARESEYPHMVWSALNLMQIYRLQGRLEEMSSLADKLYEYEAVLSPMLLAHIRLHNARANILAGQSDGSDQELTQAIQAFREARDYVGLVLSLAVLADAHNSRGDYQSELATIREAMRLHRRENLQILFTELQLRTGRALLASGRISEATDSFIGAIAEVERRGFYVVIPSMYKYMTEVALQKEYRTLALNFLERTLDYLPPLSVSELAFQTRVRLARLYAENGSYDQAYQVLSDHMDLERERRLRASREEWQELEGILRTRQEALALAQLESQLAMRELSHLHTVRIRNLSILLLLFASILAVFFAFRLRAQNLTNASLAESLRKSASAEKKC
ncbi:MAG: hypothetical protein LR015_04145 [Verrucomicrobia bacterium]|nr:hypothetical protein [Verrucomicrobiota bacterium]